MFGECGKEKGSLAGGVSPLRRLLFPHCGKPQPPPALRHNTHRPPRTDRDSAIELSILGARRHNNAAGLNRSSAVQLKCVRSTLALERWPRERSAHVPRTFRLDESAIGQILPRNPHGKAEVVFDSRAGSRLPTGALPSTTRTFRPSDAPYTAAASPLGPAPRRSGHTRRLRRFRR
jgi:hypothetical protein